MRLFKKRPGPVFVGGTGRSGTSVVGKLLSQHPEFAFLPLELRFHSERPGLTYLLEGQATVDEFTEKMRGPWFRRGSNRDRGLCRLMNEPELERLLTKFAEAWSVDLVSACRLLISDVLRTSKVGRTSWVETTPTTIERAALLRVIIPEARFVHVIRDGRDVAASVVRMPWGPDSYDDGLKWWANRLKRAYKGSMNLPEDRLCLIHLEDLTLNNRDDTYRQLVEFAGVGDHPTMRDFFDKRMPPSAANRGRWESVVPDNKRTEFERLFATALDNLRADYVDLPYQPGVGIEVL